MPLPAEFFVFVTTDRLFSGTTLESEVIANVELKIGAVGTRRMLQAEEEDTVIVATETGVVEMFVDMDEVNSSSSDRSAVMIKAVLSGLLATLMMMV